ncbi:MAG: hypothetical protein AAFR21_08085 [Pseudomonadota bacterium]
MTVRELILLSVIALAFTVLPWTAMAVPPVGENETEAMAITPVPTLYQVELKVADEKRQSFFEYEAALREGIEAAALENDAGRLLSQRILLAELYDQNGMSPEVVQSLEGVELSDLDLPALELLMRNLARLGRYRRVLMIIEERPASSPQSIYLEAAALSSLGAFSRAARRAGDIDWATLFQEGAGLPKLTAAILEATIRSAIAEPAQLRAQVASASLEPLDRQFLNLLILEREGNIDGAVQAAVSLSEQSLDPHLAVRASAFLSVIARSRGTVHPSIVGEFWTGGLGEQEITFARGLQALADSNHEEAFVAFEEVISLVPEADLALIASQEIGNGLIALGRVLQDDPEQLGARAALFIDYVQYAPPGEEGDHMIRQLTDALMELGLSSEAARLLKYQIDHRLRGAPKADVGAELARIQLGENRPDDALSALQTTRTTDLADGLVARRRALEAKALISLRRFDQAEALLTSGSNPPASIVLADLYWETRQWARAGETYLQLTEVNGEEGASFAADDILSRAAVAFALVADDDGMKSALAAASAFAASEGAIAFIHSLNEEQDNPELIFQAYKDHFASDKSGPTGVGTGL